MSTTFQRSPVTAHLIAFLAALELGPQNVSFLVGDHVIPDGSGWTTTGLGKPGPNNPDSKFKSYMVLTTMTAVPAPGTGSLDVPQEDWHLPYLLQVFGQRRDQAEATMDWVRASMGALTQTIIDCHTPVVPAPNNFKVQETWWNSIGGINRAPGSDPAFYGEQDQFTLWLSKRRT